MAGNFSDLRVVATYHERARRTVPGLAVLHGLVDQLLGEAMPSDGRLLVVGAGGGLELKYLAERHTGWSFDGVDPSAAMLELARTTLGSDAARVALHEGEIEAAPGGPCDAAVCLLTLHFLAEDARLRTLREIHARLAPGAPLVTCHISVPDGPERQRSLERFTAHASGVASADGARTMATQLPLLTPEADEALLHAAGFRNVGLFYAALALRGWVAYA